MPMPTLSGLPFPSRALRDRLQRARRLLGVMAVLCAVPCVAPPALLAQVRVNPTGVNVNVQGPTTVFLTFGGLVGHEAVEALWCGEIEPAPGARGSRCVAGTIFGQLPARFDRSTASGRDGFTDIMTIPASVARRAYQDARAGANSAFFYVRRFRSLTGGVDQYVAVTCRLAGSGARTPLSLVDVRVAFSPDVPVQQVVAGEAPPPFEATIAYTGTGRLAGRWEVVMSGEELPSVEDLLTEGTLPREARGSQRRYTQLARFNVFLPPTGRVTLPGPDPSRLPTTVDGMYTVLLRVEASNDKEGDSDLAAVGADDGVVSSGAVAGFPMPVLRYYVGSVDAVPVEPRGSLALRLPAHGATRTAEAPLAFSWFPHREASGYRLEVESDDARPLASAVVPRAMSTYVAPPWFRALWSGPVRWRVVALDAVGRPLARSAWRALGDAPPPT